jgi:hypothetical protein
MKGIFEDEYDNLFSILLKVHLKDSVGGVNEWYNVPNFKGN